MLAESVVGFMARANVEEVVLTMPDGSERTFEVRPADLDRVGIGHLASHVGFTDIGFGSLAGVPYAFWVVGALAVALHLLLSRTLLGRWLYATGHNPKAALISGVPVRRVTAASIPSSGVAGATCQSLPRASMALVSSRERKA